MAKPDPLLLAVKEILFREWDPIGVNHCEKCLTEYDNYAASICRLLRDDADEYKLTEYLMRVQRDSMGLSRFDIERDRRVARRLLELKHNN